MFPFYLAALRKDRELQQQHQLQQQQKHQQQQSSLESNENVRTAAAASTMLNGFENGNGNRKSANDNNDDNPDNVGTIMVGGLLKRHYRNHLIHNQPSYPGLPLPTSTHEHLTHPISTHHHYHQQHHHHNQHQQQSHSHQHQTHHAHSNHIFQQNYQQLINSVTNSNGSQKSLEMISAASSLVESMIDSDLILQALNGFLLILTCDGEVFYTSHTVETYLGFHQVNNFIYWKN